ncbi:cytochrome P450 [Aspergillus pseudoustus]|uniref:Cytochrome P450 n=1 Tax=Aspergillus pseudoustus TaxID=1810923 RepID=A0ABR4K4A7_9EURO
MPIWTMLALLGVCAPLYTLLLNPIIAYLIDRKSLRKYTSYNLFCALTNAGWCLEAWRGGIRSKSLSALHKTHPVIRIGPDSLSYGHPDAYRDIYGHGSKCVKDTFYQTEAAEGAHFNLGNVIDKAEHTRKRKMLAGAFSARNVQDHWEGGVVRGAVRMFLSAVEAHCTAPLVDGTDPNPHDLNFDFRLWSNLFTIDAIGEIAMSDQLGLLERGKDTVTAETVDGKVYTVPFRDCLHASKIAHARLAYADKWYHFNSRYATRLFPSYRHLWKLSAGWSDFVNHQAKKRLARHLAGEKLNDIFEHIMHDREGTPYNLEWGEISAECAVILDAGSATTAIALNNVIYWLARNPICLARLREEVDHALDAGGEEDAVAPYDKVKNLPYLRACLDESLRITPPFSYNLPRRTPPDGATILGEYVPGDTTVSMSAYVAHRDASCFVEPDNFIPERWLGEKRKEIQGYFVAFSAGSRGCIGRNISYLEQTVLVANFVRQYEFSLPCEGWEQERVEVTNLLPGALPLKVWRREIRQ